MFTISTVIHIRTGNNFSFSLYVKVANYIIEISGRSDAASSMPFTELEIKYTLDDGRDRGQ